MNRLLTQTYVGPSFGADDLWVLNPFTGAYGYVDKKTNTQIIMGKVGFAENGECLFNDVIYANKLLFFVPNAAFYIEVRDISGEIIKRIPIKNTFDNKEILIKGGLFLSVFLHDNYVFLFGYDYPAIIRVHTKTLECNYYDEWLNCFGDRLSTRGDVGFFNVREMVVLEQELYVPFCGIPCVLKINLKNMNISYMELVIKSQGISCIQHIEDKTFALIGGGENADWLYIWDSEANVIEREVRLQESPNYFPVKRILKSKNGELFLFPWQNHNNYYLDIYKYEISGKDVENTFILNDFYDETDKREYLIGNEVIYADWEDDNTFVFLTGRDLLWHRYSLNTKEHTTYDISINQSNVLFEDVVRSYYDRCVSQKIPFKESVEGLKDFLRYLK